MPTYTLTATRRSAYATLFDFRTQFVKAARQILSNGGITAVGPGEGVAKTPRYNTSVDFSIGAATGRKTPVFLGEFRYSEYSQFLGTLSIMNAVPYETEEKTGNAYLTENHVRLLDELTSTEHALFMEHLEPFAGLDGDGALLLPNLDVQELIPMEPDERPAQDREINLAFKRWRVKFEIRRSAWPTVE
jgi:hypothetical protein